MSNQCKSCKDECKSGELHVCWECWKDVLFAKGWNHAVAGGQNGACVGCWNSIGHSLISGEKFAHRLCFDSWCKDVLSVDTSGSPVPWVSRQNNLPLQMPAPASPPAAGVPKVCLNCVGVSGLHYPTCHGNVYEGGHVFTIVGNGTQLLECMNCLQQVDFAKWVDGCAGKRTKCSPCQSVAPVIPLTPPLGARSPTNAIPLVIPDNWWPEVSFTSPPKTCSVCSVDWCEYLDAHYTEAARNVCSRCKPRNR